jgi:hypothetical protein
MGMDAIAVLASIGGGGGLLRALRLAFGMTWEITWALIPGSTLSAIVQSVGSKRRMAWLLPNDRLSDTRARLWAGGGVQLLLGCGGGAGRAIFRKGASFTAASLSES